MSTTPQEYRDVRIHEIKTVAPGTHLLVLRDAFLARHARPGHFLNVRVSSGTAPLLRRPFTIYRVEDEFIELLILTVGIGTECLTQKKAGDIVNIVGPLGNTFTFDQPCSHAFLVAGGVGIAPMPFLTAYLRARGTEIRTFVGARSRNMLITGHLENVRCATDDGSEGLHGTVVDLLTDEHGRNRYASPYIFACGPTPMLRAVQEFCARTGIPGEASLEGEMACGIGICQGCPVEAVDGDKKYKLVCHDGTVFNFRHIRL